MLQLLIQDSVYREAANSYGDLAAIHKKWHELAKLPEADWDISVMALGQHYGIPTHGIDVTSDILIAVWFATHKFKMGDDGVASYTSLREEDWPKDPNLWPVIYVIQPVTHSVVNHLSEI